MTTHATIRIIFEEHAALSAMLRSMLMLLAQHRRDKTLSDFAVLRSMLFYVDEFPDKRHHRTESEVLFPSCAPAHRFHATCWTSWTTNTAGVNAASAISNTCCSASR